MVLSPEERLAQSSSTMRAGSSQLERAGRKEAEPDVPCTICMSNISNAAYVDGCLHSFCFGCIQQWAARRAVCPLCRRPFDRFLHTVRADDDYQVYVVSSSARRPRPVARAQLRSRYPPWHNHLHPRPSTALPVPRRSPAGSPRGSRRDAAPGHFGAAAQQDGGERPAGLAEAPSRRYNVETLRVRLLAFVERH